MFVPGCWVLQEKQPETKAANTETGFQKGQSCGEGLRCALPDQVKIAQATERVLQPSSSTENTYTMATPNNSTNGDAAANKSSFSYAQAAKGSSAPPTPSLQSESNTWSGAADPTTGIDEPSHGQDVAGSKHSDTESASSTSTKDEKAAPSVVSDLAASSVLAGKDEDTISDVTSRSETAAEQSSQQAASGVQTPEIHEEKEVGRGKGKRRSEKEKTEQAEKPAPVPMKEAPVPSVNIWQQRAQEAKQKQPASMSGVPEKVQSLTTTSSKSTEVNTAQPGQTAPTRSSSYPQREEGAPRSSPLPPRNDAMSWPTPLSAQEVQEKSDKEKPSTSTAPTKSHGKNEWKPVPYTPSVKFNTPMPAIRGKTARTGARGGRLAGPGDRTTPMLPNGNINEVEGEFKPRAKSEGGLMRSSTLPSNSRRPAGGHGSAEHPSTSVTDSPTNHVGTENGDSQQGLAPNDSNSGGLASGQDTGVISGQSVNGEVPTAVADPSSTTAQQPKSGRRRVSHSAGASEFAGGEKKRASESGVPGDRASWIETREKGEGRKESWPVSHRDRPDGRPERGRGHKASRGLHSQAPHMGLPQYGLPQGMIAGHHSKNPSFTYYPPGPPQTSRGYRAGRASMPADGNFARFAFPAGQPYMDYPYPNAMYAYQAPMPATAFSYAPQMEQQVVISAISVQL